MRIRNFAIASIAAMAMAMPAWADLVFEFRQVPSINPTNSNLLAALPTTTANMTNLGPAGAIFITVGIRDTLVGTTTQPPVNPGPGPRSSIPGTTAFPNPRWYDALNEDTSVPNTDQAMGLIQHFARIQNVLNIGQPPPPAGTNLGHVFIPPPAPDPVTNGQFGNANLRIVGGNSLPMSFIAGGSYPPILSDFGGLSTGAGIVPNYFFGNALTEAGAYNGFMPLFTMRLEASAAGTETIQVFDRNMTGDDFQVFLVGGGAGDPANFITLDGVLFSAAHPNFNLSVTVVPEPSSMALAGMALAGLGYKLRRKMKAKAAATA